MLFDMVRRLGAFVMFTVLTQCVSPAPREDAVVVNPADPGEKVSTSTSTAQVCGTICDALVAEYGVPKGLRAACIWECASGFESSPDGCYELVACIADHSLCSGIDISASCMAKAGACLGTWGLANGSCRGCWKPSRTIRGKQLVTYVSEFGSEPKPEDYSATTIAAHLPGAAGTEYVFPGTGSADGTYLIPKVPGCGVWVQVGKTYTWSGNQDVDTSYAYQGRNNAKLASDGTTFTFNVTGLVPWTQDDWLEYFAPQLGWYPGAFWGIPFDETVIPDLATTFTWQMIASGNALPDTSQGDVLYFTHLPASTLGDGSLLRVAQKAARIDTMTAKDGVDNPVTVSLTDITGPTLKAHIDWRRSTYALGADLNPSSILAGDPSNPFFQDPDSVGLLTFPGQVNVGASAELFLLEPPSGTADVAPADISFRTPYPADWSKEIWSALTWNVPLTDRTGKKFFAVERVLATLPFEKLGTTPLQARLGPVKNPKIDGEPAFGQLTGTSLTPTVSWEPPALGSPQSYELSVVAIGGQTGQQGKQVARFVIPPSADGSVPAPTRVTLVPGILQANSDYFFRIIVRSVVDQRTDEASVVTAEYRP